MSYIEKLPNWLRWILFLPIAIVGSLLGQIIIGLLSLIITPETSTDWIKLVNSYVGTYIFMEIATAIAPKNKDIVAISLTSTITTCIILFFLYFLIVLKTSLYSYDLFLLVVADIITIATMIYVTKITIKAQNENE